MAAALAGPCACHVAPGLSPKPERADRRLSSSAPAAPLGGLCCRAAPAPKPQSGAVSARQPPRGMLSPCRASAGTDCTPATAATSASAHSGTSTPELDQSETFASSATSQSGASTSDYGQSQHATSTTGQLDGVSLATDGFVADGSKSFADAAAATEGLADPGQPLPLVINSSTRSPIRPREWAEAAEKRAAGYTAARQGVAIRRRPPSGPAGFDVGPMQFVIENEDNVPRNILEEIVWHKDGEIFKAKERMPLQLLHRALPKAPPPRDFVGALRDRYQETDVPALIAEVKKASPSRGVIQPDFDPVRIAQAYERGGAACLSVLTDSKYFQGSFENLKMIRAAGVQCPLLCKEFIVDPWQLYMARVMGADAALLIAAVLPDQDLRYMIKIARRLKLATLIEVHSEEEMDRVLGLDDVQLIGINNRDLGTFKVDLSNTVRLLDGERGRIIRDRGILVVGESGLFVPEDVKKVQEAGCSAVLVGESLVKQTDPETGIALLMGKNIARKPVNAAEVASATA